MHHSNYRCIINDKFSYLIIEQVVSDSVCSESGEHGSTDVFKKKKRNREK